MEFQTPSQEECYQRVSRWITEIFGEMATSREDIPAFGIQYGSAWVTSSVLPWGHDDAIVRILPWVVTGTELTPDLMRYLLEVNGTVRFGAFAADEAGDILFAHNLIGSTCQKADLKMAMARGYGHCRRTGRADRGAVGGLRALDWT